MYTNGYYLFLPRSDATKSSMEEALRYADHRLQKGMHYIVHHYNYIFTRITKCIMRTGTYIMVNCQTLLVF